MNYSQLIRDAWTATWRYRFLWILGLFAGGAAGAGSSGQGQWRVDRSNVGQWSPKVVDAADTAANWLAANWVFIAIGAGIVALACLVVSFIAEGGMATATADIAAGRPTSLRQAWRAGLHLFWRYVGLTLALIAVALMGAAIVGALLALAIGTGVFAAFTTTADAARIAIVAILLLITIPVLLAVVAATVVFSIVATYAQRAVAIEDEGPVAALGDGWQLFRRNAGASMLVWLVNVALSIGAGIAVSVAVVAAFAVLGLIGLALWAVVGANLATIIYAALAGAVLVAVALTAAAIVNTFFWHYWTLAYLRLRERLQPASGALPA
jgi:hypothetical protein